MIENLLKYDDTNMGLNAIFYASENDGFASAMKAKNYTMASFVLSELAAKYRELQGFK